MLRHRSTRLLAGALVLTFLLAACRWTAINDPASKLRSAAGINWLKTQQQADGGFEVAGFPGFETPDAVLAIGSQAQTSDTWNPTLARNAVIATVHNGFSPLHAVDDFADGTGANAIDAGQAAKLIVLVTGPLGLSATNFNPDGDASKNLVATLDAGLQPNGSYGTFNDTLYAVIAKRVLGVTPPATSIALIRAGQQANGGWSYTGSPSGSDLDIDTTALAIEALIGGGATATDADVNQGLTFLAVTHQASGAWQSFSADDPNSTSTATLAVSAAGFDANSSCWRNTVAPALRNNPYGNPLTWLGSKQLASGQIASPNDQYGVNTFATTQSVEALLRYYLPVAPLAVRTC